jgi:hypothetical protein
MAQVLTQEINDDIAPIYLFVIRGISGREMVARLGRFRPRSDQDVRP